MSNLSELLPAGAGAKSATFVASGTLASGVTVALKSNGQVEAVGLTPAALGAETTFNPATSFEGYFSSTYDSVNNKIVIAGRDQSQSFKGYAYVGTISGTSITFGTPVQFTPGTDRANGSVAITYDVASGNVVIFWSNIENSNYATAIVGTVSGTSITFGTGVVFDSSSVSFAEANTNSATYHSGQDVCVLSYNNSAGTLSTIACSVSGTTPTFGSKVTPGGTAFVSIDNVYDVSADRIVTSGQLAGTGMIVLSSCSGTTMTTRATDQQFNTGTDYTALAYDPINEKTVVVYSDTSNSSKGSATVCTVSASSVTFGTEVVFQASGTSEWISAAYDASAQKIVVASSSAANSDSGQIYVGAVSGTDISFSGQLAFNGTSVTNRIRATYATTAKQTCISYVDYGNSTRGSAILYSNIGTNSADFVGITDEAISSAASGSVIVQGGVSSKLSGLTVGADYYVQTDGSISSPTVYIPYDITSATYAAKSFSIAAQETSPRGLAINPAGTKLFVLGTSGDDVNEYALSIAFDVSSASFTQAFSIASQDNNPWGITFNPTGTKMFTTGLTGVGVDEFALSSGFDVSTASFTQFLSTSAQTATPRGIEFNADGSKMFLVDNAAASIDEYTLSSGFNVSTASYSQTFSVSANVTSPLGLAFSTDGTEMFVTMQNTTYEITRYSLSTAFDISTASYTQRLNVQSATPVDPTEDKPSAIVFNSTGTQFIILGATNDTVYQYAVSLGSTSTVPAGRALSSTSILLEG